MLESPDYFFRVREIGRLRQTTREHGLRRRGYVKRLRVGDFPRIFPRTPHLQEARWPCML